MPTKAGWFVDVKAVRKISPEELTSIRVENFQEAFLQRLEKYIWDPKRGR